MLYCTIIFYVTTGLFLPRLASGSYTYTHECHQRSVAMKPNAKERGGDCSFTEGFNGTARGMG